MEKILQVLKMRGYSDPEIAQFLNKLYELGWQDLYSKIQEVFTEEDMEALDKCTTEEETNKTIAYIYKLRTGRDVQTEMQEFITKYSEEQL